MPPIGPEQGAVADEPGEDVAGGIGDEFPRHHHDADDAGDQPADAEGDFPRGEVGKIIRGTDHVGGDIRGKRCHAKREHRNDEDDRVLELRQDIDRIPDRFAVNDSCRRCDGDADERIERHRRGRPSAWPIDLVAPVNAPSEKSRGTAEGAESVAQNPIMPVNAGNEE